MGTGINLLYTGMNNSSALNDNIFIQENEPSTNKGLWIKSGITPSKIISLPLEEIMPIFCEWEIISLPSGYSSIAVVKDNIYLIGHSNGTYAKASLKERPYSWSYHTAGTNILFTASAVIGSNIFATLDSNKLSVYQMDVDDTEPSFQLILPEMASINNPRICSYGSKLYALRGATSGTQPILELDTKDLNPAWTTIANLSEHSAQSSIIALDDMLYIIGILSSGYKCYALDLNNPTVGAQAVTVLGSQGTYYAPLSTVGGILRILVSGYATTARNCLSLISGVWKFPIQTGLTFTSYSGSSNTNAYHNDYGVFFKDKFSNDLLLLSRRYPEIDTEDNTIVLVKGNGAKVNTISSERYNCEEKIILCYLINLIEDEQILTRIDIAYYNETNNQWEDIER